MVGRKVKVLFEKRGRREGQLIGKSEYLHATHAFAPDYLLGEVADVLITASETNSLTGELASA
jgi:tRNA-2-methylthio-N6-dimethylallyladenosine synthase